MTSKKPSLKIPEPLQQALKAAADKQAQDLVVLDLRPVATFTDFFLLVSGTNQRQLVAIVDALLENLRKRQVRPDHIEGYPRQEWILLDFGSFIVHVLTPRMRSYYDLERLWGGARRMEVSA
jgi:ribosome-associated protein